MAGRVGNIGHQAVQPQAGDGGNFAEGGGELGGTVVFQALGAEPQEISVAVDATKPLGPIVKLVSERLIAAVQDCLAAARGQGARTV